MKASFVNKKKQHESRKFSIFEKFASVSLFRSEIGVEIYFSMGGKSAAVFHLKGLLILAVCIAFTVVIFWVARIIHATNVLFTSAVAAALSSGKDTTSPSSTVKGELQDCQIILSQFLPHFNQFLLPHTTATLDFCEMLSQFFPAGSSSGFRKIVISGLSNNY